MGRDDPFDPFMIEMEGQVAWLVMNQPAKRNAMGMAFYQSLNDHMRRFDQDDNVRAVVIKGAGPSFTSGTDLAEAGALIGDGAADARERLHRKITSLQADLTSIETCCKPVIAAIHGHCIGGGVDLIAACDIRLAAQGTLFSVRETRLGIIADVGTLQRLPHIIGHGWFRELALTGRDFSAEEALQMGLVTRVCPDREALYDAARELASQIAACPPLTVQGTKEVILYSRDNGVFPGLAYVAQKNAAALPSEDLMEAVSALMDKREPVFKGK